MRTTGPNKRPEVRFTSVKVHSYLWRVGLKGDSSRHGELRQFLQQFMAKVTNDTLGW